MLAQFNRLRMVNQTGQTMDYDAGARIAIRIQWWKFVAGVIVYETVVLEPLGFSGGETIVDAAEVEGAVYDNSIDKQWGANGTFEITHDVDAALGQCRLYLESSDNDGNWPSDADDFTIGKLIQICVLPVDNSGVDKSVSKNFVF